MLKYTIKNYVTPMLKGQIIKALKISDKTYYNKVNAEIGSNYGFEACELISVSVILNRPADQLITEEAFRHYQIIKEE